VLRRVVVIAAVVATAACGDGSASPSAPTHVSGTSSAPDRPEAGPLPPPDARRIRVIAVFDGDSLQAEVDAVVEEIRIRGINAPERDECWGDEARSVLEDLLTEAAEVSLLPAGRDQYGRLLADLWAGSDRVGLSMVERGAALALSTGTASDEDYVAAEEAAFRAASGLWAPDACGLSPDTRMAIARVRFDAPGPDDENPNGEWVVLANHGPAVELTGWVLRDESSVHRYTFPEGFVLGSGAEVTVHSGCGADGPGQLFWCEGAVWTNSGDMALLLDSHGNVVDRSRP
jgi:micrococcal nuclease